MRSRFTSVLVALLAVLALGVVAAGGASAHQWKVNGVEASGQGVAFSGGEIMFSIGGGTKQILCKGMTGTGTVKGAGAGEAAEMKWTGCELVGKPNCVIKTAGQSNGTIATTNIVTALRETRGGVLVNEFKGKVEKGEFMRLEFIGGLSNCEAELNGKVLFSGDVAAQATSVESGDVELLFQQPGFEVEGKKGLSSFGREVALEGTVNEGLVGGGVLTAS